MELYLNTHSYGSLSKLSHFKETNSQITATLHTYNGPSLQYVKTVVILVDLCTFADTILDTIKYILIL